MRVGRYMIVAEIGRGEGRGDVRGSIEDLEVYVARADATDAAEVTKARARLIGLRARSPR